MAEEEKENITEEGENETESSEVSSEESIDESIEDAQSEEETSESETPNEEVRTSNEPTPNQVKGYKRNITGLGIALGVLILLAAVIVVALIVRGINEDTTCTNEGTCEVCEVCTENVDSKIAPLTYTHDVLKDK